MRVEDFDTPIPPSGLEGVNPFAQRMIPTEWEINRNLKRRKEGKARSYGEYIKTYRQLAPLREAGDVFQYQDPMRRWNNPLYKGTWREFGYKSGLNGPESKSNVFLLWAILIVGVFILFITI